MDNPRESAGFKKKSFAMAFGGGEIWFEHLDGLFGFGDLVKEKLAADLPQIKKPSSPSLIAVNLDETKITSAVASAVASALADCGKRGGRVVFVGTDFISRRRLKTAVKAAELHCAVGFVNDFEKAKEWLVNERR